MKATTKKGVPSSIDAYLAALPADQRVALGALRSTIAATAPKAEECISYGLPMFRLSGKPLIYFGAAAGHCAIYGAVDAEFKEALADFDTSGKGTIRFSPDHPVPTTLVRKLVKARMAKLDLKTKTGARERA